MEPEGSLPHSQVPATCPYPEPARFSPYPHIPLPEDPLLVYYTVQIFFNARIWSTQRRVYSEKGVRIN